MYIGINYFKRTFCQTAAFGGDVIPVQVIFGVAIFVGFIKLVLFPARKRESD